MTRAKRTRTDEADAAQTAPAAAETPAEAPKAPEPEAPATLAMIGPEPVMITVTGPKRGRWRAGRHFTAEPVQIPVADLTEEDIAALVGDPRLSVAGLPVD